MITGGRVLRIGRAISETNLSDWPENRRAAFERMLNAILESLLATEDTGWAIDMWMCGISKMGLDIEPFLLRIEASPPHVLSYYQENSASLMKGKLGNSFGERLSTGHDKIVEWFQSPRVSNLISTAYGL